MVDNLNLSWLMRQDADLDIIRKAILLFIYVHFKTRNPRDLNKEAP